jgi:catechol 2,3-dioxygenase-like lactoylglutathione lyase family enzyme
MQFDAVSAADFGRSLQGLSLNILVRDPRRSAAFLADVFGMVPARVSADYAILLYHGQPLQLHADATYHSHPLPGLLPEAGPRGAGAEFRLHETDPDAAVARAALHPEATILQSPADKPHGLREAFILCADGYAWVPSRRL